MLIYRPAPTTLIKPQPWGANKLRVDFRHQSIWDGLVLGMPFPEGIAAPRDYSGYGNHATFTGGATDPTWADGSRGPVLDFDDSDNGYLDVPDAPSLKPSSLSVAVWFKPDLVETDYIVTKRNANGWIMYTTAPDNLNWSVDGSLDTATGVVAVGAWVHGVGIISPSIREFYVNGALIASNSDAGYTTTTNALRIGNTPTANRPFDGQMENILMWNRVLLPTEIQLLYTDPFGWYRERRRVSVTVLRSLALMGVGK